MFMASAVDFILIFRFARTRHHQLLRPRRLHAAEQRVARGRGQILDPRRAEYGLSCLWHYLDLRTDGETNLARIAQVLPALFAEGGRLHGSESALLFGIMLVLVALGFKIAAAPFQLWVPDVYQGRTDAVTAFLSVGSKAAGFLVLIRVLEPFLAVEAVRAKVLAVLAILAVATLLYGNLAAMPQDNLKRMLAYSSIGHAGYLLVAVASVNAATSTFGNAGTAIATISPRICS
jgi:NADH-quinone oxidoreductase subunit N